MTSDRNDSVKILNLCASFLPDTSSILKKSNYAKLLARSILPMLAGTARQGYKNIKDKRKIMIFGKKLKDTYSK